jgi:heme ABC exporter ATP-binding subunit CcmA
VSAGDAAWAVELRDVSMVFDYRPVLRGVDLRVRPGEVLAILGANGSGKSTLLRLMAALARPTRGTVALFGRDPHASPELRGRIGYVPHTSLLYDSLTVEENLRFFAALYAVAPAHVWVVLDASGLRPLARRRVRILSRGQRQQADLARALLHDPSLLLLDEPFTGLDLDAAARLSAAIRDAAGVRTVVFATHDLAEARRFATGAAVLVAGRLSTPRPPRTLDEAELLAAPPAPRP